MRLFGILLFACFLAVAPSVRGPEASESSEELLQMFERDQAARPLGRSAVGRDTELGT